MNRWIIIILFPVWHCFFQPAAGVYALEEAKTAPSALNGAGVLDVSNRSNRPHSLKIDNKKITRPLRPQLLFRVNNWRRSVGFFTYPVGSNKRTKLKGRLRLCFTAVPARHPHIFITCIESLLMPGSKMQTGFVRD
jgi:hypothetical protein